ncbi:hypothetical protein J7337_012935 [Fusarium musae]|uniref:Uncharacterized protein n=1 Tax=Fusarium musae TaxID=1042133 RepID=A0A9P8D6Q3_9HYPO|nr:hypothetical protein J7337_012935 [Fusarium musae]KAG9496348.1 hypothetical protein J7337_012935 [Fusarium musae]
MANYGTSKVGNRHDSVSHPLAQSGSTGSPVGLSSDPKKIGLNNSMWLLDKLKLSLKSSHQEQLRILADGHQKRENDLCREIERLKRENKAQKDTVRRAQEASEAMMEQSKSFASGDNEVEIWFRRRSDDWYEWARCFAHQDPLRLAAVSSQAWNELTEFVALQDGRLPGGLADDPKTPYLLLQGMLANFICKHAFSTPWWIFDALSHLGVSPEERERLINNSARDEERIEQILCLDGGELPTSGSMDILFDILQHLQEDSSHKLRVSLVRLFAANGMEANADRPVRGKNEALIDARLCHAKYLTNMFLQSPACNLLRHLPNEELQGRSDGLHEQIDQALQKSLELWTHRSQMRCVALPQLRDQGRLDFDLGSGLMQLHRAYQVDDWRKYEGSRIVVVVQPAIVVYGTERGDNYSCMRRVWAPAKVLIDGVPVSTGRSVGPRAGANTWPSYWSY